MRNWEADKCPCLEKIARLGTTKQRGGSTGHHIKKCTFFRYTVSIMCGLMLSTLLYFVHLLLDLKILLKDVFNIGFILFGTNTQPNQWPVQLRGICFYTSSICIQSLFILTAGYFPRLTAFFKAVWQCVISVFLCVGPCVCVLCASALTWDTHR